MWVAATVLATTVAACGGGDGDADVLAGAEDRLAELRSGRMTLVMTASTGEGEDGAGPVGFRVEGSFSFESDGDLPVLDLTYTRILDEEQELTVGSDGEQAWVVSEGDVTDVPPEQLETLRLGDGDRGGIPELDLAAWVDEPVVEERNGETIVTGELDAAEMLEDLQRITAEVAGETTDEIDDEEAERLRGLVRDSSVEVVTVGEDHELRSLSGSVDFGADVPGDLRDAFGAYAGARLELTLTIEELDGELKVEHP